MLTLIVTVIAAIAITYLLYVIDAMEDKIKWIEDELIACKGTIKPFLCNCGNKEPVTTSVSEDGKVVIKCPACRKRTDKMDSNEHAIIAWNYKVIMDIYKRRKS